MGILTSSKPGIASTEVRYLNKEELIALRDGGVPQRCVEAVRNGNLNAKRRNYYMCIQGRFPEGVEVGTRLDREMIGTNKVALDNDSGSDEDIEAFLNLFIEKKDEYGTLEVERTTRNKGKVTVRRIEGLSILATIKYYEWVTGYALDHSFQNVSHASFLMPSSEVRYEHPDFFATEVETNRNIDVSGFLAAQQEEKQQKVWENTENAVDQKDGEREAEELAASTRTAYAYPNFVSNSTFEKDLDLDRAEIRMIVDRCEKLGIDLCSSYIEWFRVAMALFNTLGSEGYEYFYRLSMLWLGGTPKEKEIQNKWKSIEKCAGKKSTGKRITIATLISYARDAGVY